MIKQIPILILFLLAGFISNAGLPSVSENSVDMVSLAVRSDLKFDFNLIKDWKNQSGINLSDDFHLPSLRPHLLYKTDERNLTLKERPVFLQQRVEQKHSVQGLRSFETFSLAVKISHSAEVVCSFDMSNLGKGTKVGLF